MSIVTLEKLSAVAKWKLTYCRIQQRTLDLCFAATIPSGTKSKPCLCSGGRQPALAQWSIDHGSHIWKKCLDQLLQQESWNRVERTWLGWWLHDQLTDLGCTARRQRWQRFSSCWSNRRRWSTISSCTNGLHLLVEVALEGCLVVRKVVVRRRGVVSSSLVRRIVSTSTATAFGVPRLRSRYAPTSTAFYSDQECRSCTRLRRQLCRRRHECVCTVALDDDSHVGLHGTRRRTKDTVGGTHVCPPNRGERSTASRVANQPPTILSSSHSPSFSPSPERCKVSQQVWNRVMNWTWTCVSPYCDLLD